MKTLEIPAIIDEAKAAGCEDADQIAGYLAADVSRLRSLLQQMLNVAENADETGYVADVGFIDLDKLHEEVRTALETPEERTLRRIAATLAVSTDPDGAEEDAKGL